MAQLHILAGVIRQHILVMQTSTVLLLLGLAVCCSQDIVCEKGRLSLKEINVGEGDSFVFKTQDMHLNTYAPNTNCHVTYKRANSCSKMRFYCSVFKINNKHKNCKVKDKMQIQISPSKKFYCGVNGPDVTTSAKYLRVSFLSDKRKQSSGATCRVECVAPLMTDATKTTIKATTTKTTSTTSMDLTLFGGSCPQKKLVGGKNYSLAGTSYKTIYNCISTCIYEKDEIPRSKFCFTSGDMAMSVKKNNAKQYCHKHMEDVLDYLSTPNQNVYCCNNGIVTSAQCGGLGPYCKYACGDITCVKFHPKPEKQVCNIGENHMFAEGEIKLENGYGYEKGCKTKRCAKPGVCRRMSCGVCLCCLTRGYYLSCRSKKEKSCRCNCQCKKYEKRDLCKMKSFCGNCRVYHNKC